jgi:hypothetical protein
MQQYEKKNLLIIYQDSAKYHNTDKLDSLFDVIIIPKLIRFDIKEFKLEGNHLVTKYNDILFSTNSDYVFFICSSELNEPIINKLLNFNGSENDFDFFTGKKTNNLITYLSGLVVKKEVLIRIGCFDKHTFHNLYLNFLINYSRFFGKVPDNVFFRLKLGSSDFFKYSYWSYFENASYLRKPLHKKDYLVLNEKMEAVINNNILKKVIGRYMKWKMEPSLSETGKIVESTTYLEYW